MSQPLASFTEDYIVRADCSARYADQLRWCVRGFGSYLGRDPVLSDLSAESINRWLGSMKTAGLAAETRRSRRRMLLTLSTDAARQRLIQPIPRELVARVKAHPTLPTGLSYVQARTVVEKLTHPDKPHRRWLNYTYRSTGICRGDYWRAFILASWDTGAPADLRDLRWSEIQPDGRVFRLRGKTQKPLAWVLSPATLSALEEIRSPEREFVFPLSGRLEVFRRDAKYVIQVVAGIPDRTLGDFRSGAGTDAELTHGTGAGSKLLGNTPAVFDKHYAVRHLLPVAEVAPRPLVDTTA